jgi:hypothetical protein
VDIFDGRPCPSRGFPKGFQSTVDHYHRLGDLPRRTTIGPDEVGIIGFTMSNSQWGGDERIQYNYQFFIYLGELA